MGIGRIEWILVVLAVVCSVAVHLLTAYLALPRMKQAILGGWLAYGWGGCAVIAAIVTPPDALSMVVVIIPLGFVFLVCAGIFAAVRYKQVTKGE